MHRRLLAVLIAAVTLLPACNRGSGPLVDEDRMVEIVAELHLANARAELYGSVPEGTREAIYRRYNADSASVARTLRHYADDPGRYGEFYDRVLNRIKEEEVQLHESARR